MSRKVFRTRSSIRIFIFFVGLHGIRFFTWISLAAPGGLRGKILTNDRKTGQWAGKLSRYGPNRPVLDGHYWTKVQVARIAARSYAAIMDFKSYCFRLGTLVSKQRTANFELGDWLRDGEEEFGKRVYAAAARATGLPVSSLHHIANVSKQVPRKSRNNKLSWRHHRLVQSFSPDRQRMLLREAEPLGESDSALPVHRFREKIQFRFPGTFKSKRTGPHRRFCFSIPEQQFASLEKLAEARQMTLTDYIAEIVARHESSPFAQAALLDAKATRDMRSAENRRKGREQWERRTRRSIDDLIEQRYETTTGSGNEGADFVRAWRLSNGGKAFPLAFAQRHTTFGDHYGDLTAEDLRCGKFTPVDEEFDSFDEDEVA